MHNIQIFDVQTLAHAIKSYCIANFGEVLEQAHMNFVTVDRGVFTEIYLPKIFCNRAAFLVEVLLRVASNYNSRFVLHVPCNPSNDSLTDLGFVRRQGYWSKEIT